MISPTLISYMIYSSVFVSLQRMVSEKPVFIVGINEKHFQFYNVVISVKRSFFFRFV